MVIDPGTGAYYPDAPLRNWLASRAAHNGPAWPGSQPVRAGPFLWKGFHGRPNVVEERAGGVNAGFHDIGGRANRTIYRVEKPLRGGWVVDEKVFTTDPDSAFNVLWQFAPGTECEIIESRRFRIMRRNKVVEIRVSSDWEAVDLVATEPARKAGEFEGTVSLRFRTTKWAPYLKLTGRAGAKPCLFTTTFLTL